MQSILQILKVNEPKTGTSKKTGNAYDMQDAECALLDDTGELVAVGVLQIPKGMRGEVQKGIYLGTFALRAGMMDRRIEAVLTGLQPYTVKAPPPVGFTPSPIPAPSK
jgi:hypothetical protein